MKRPVKVPAVNFLTAHLSEIAYAGGYAHSIALHIRGNSAAQDVWRHGTHRLHLGRGVGEDGA